MSTTYGTFSSRTSGAAEESPGTHGSPSGTDPEPSGTHATSEPAGAAAVSQDASASPLPTGSSPTASPPPPPRIHRPHPRQPSVQSARLTRGQVTTVALSEPAVQGPLRERPQSPHRRVRVLVAVPPVLGEPTRLLVTSLPGHTPPPSPTPQSSPPTAHTTPPVPAPPEATNPAGCPAAP